MTRYSIGTLVPFFPNDEAHECQRCRARIYFRPNAPRTTTKICKVCLNALASKNKQTIGVNKGTPSIALLS